MYVFRFYPKAKVRIIIQTHNIIVQKTQNIQTAVGSYDKLSYLCA